MSTAAESTETDSAATATRLTHSKVGGARKAKNSLATVLIWAAFIIALIPLVSILWTVFSRGGSALVDASWWQKDQSGAGAPQYDTLLRGARHAVVGTLLIGACTAVIAIPLAVFTAIYLVEYGRGRLARTISFMVDILSGIPSIVAALFIYAVWVSTLGWQLIPICSCLALAMLMIPVVTRSTEEMLKLVPNELREASYALGVPKWKTISKVVLPTAFSGILTGALLGLARVMGETAPLLLLASYTPYLNQNVFGGSMAALPTFINEQSQTLGIDLVRERAWGAAATLVLIVLAINLLGRLVGRLTKVKN